MAADVSSRPEPTLTAVIVMRRYQWGITAITAALVTVSFLTAGSVASLPWWVHGLCLTGLYLSCIQGTRHLLHDSDWGLDRYLLVAITLGVAALVGFALPASELLTTHHWTLIPTGWALVVCLLDRHLSVILVALSVNVTIVLAALGHADRLDKASLVAFAITAIEITTQQIAAAAFAIPLRRAVVESARDAMARTRLLTADVLANRLQQDRQNRLGDLRRTAVPLLRRLAEGSADPSNAVVRWQSRVEASRMRRLFAESDPTDDPLLHAVRATIEEVTRAGVAVTLVCASASPPMSSQLRRALLEDPMATLSCATSNARVVITREANDLSVSVVTDGPAPPPAEHKEPHIRVRTTTTESKTWTQATCRLPSLP